MLRRQNSMLYLSFEQKLWYCMTGILFLLSLVVVHFGDKSGYELPLLLSATVFGFVNLIYISHRINKKIVSANRRTD